ncbi:MAG: site-2 protease family protein, partial [Desulfobacterales bacterium]|nr:site-2 protease family protein [Desulfobacterales bacterium]
TNTIILGLVWYAVFLVSAIVHEAAHALVAFRLGDRTAYHGGQVTLDPIPHIRQEPMGMILFPIVSYFLGGWMLGWASCPYDPMWAERNPKSAGKMALAGPVSNLILMFAALIFIKIMVFANVFIEPDSIQFPVVAQAAEPGFAHSLALFAGITFGLNLLLFLFNLMPVPPFDGFAGLALILDSRTYSSFKQKMYQTQGISIIGFIIAWNVFPFIFKPIYNLALIILYPDVKYG